MKTQRRVPALFREFLARFEGRHLTPGDFQMIVEGMNA